MLEKFENITEVNQDEVKVMIEENRHEKTREIVKLIGRTIMENLGEKTAKYSIFDVGCGVGELIYHLKTIFTCSEFTGIDISQDLIDKATRMVSGANFIKMSIFDAPNKILKKQFDVVTMGGVLGFFDNIEKGLPFVLDLVKKNGILVVTNAFNDDPIDVVIRYRNSCDEKWKAGWNIFSKQTCEKLLAQYGASVAWKDFKIGFKIDKRTASPMRTWTIKTEDNPFQLINGACQVINLSLMVVKKN